VSALPRQKCIVDGCPELEELVNGRAAGGLCQAHRRRKQRKSSTVAFEAPIQERFRPRTMRSARALLREKALAFADVDALDLKAFQRADWNLGYAAQQYVEQLQAKRARRAQRVTHAPTPPKVMRRRG
jgi:L-asparaginase II